MKRRRTETRILREKADRLWSAAVKEDWNHRCAMCGKRGSLNAHHLIPRQHESTRYELRNGICLCAHCHQFDAHRSPHQNAAGFMQWLHQAFGLAEEWYCEMIANRSYRTFGGKLNAEYYVEVIQLLEQYVDVKTFERICGKRFEDTVRKYIQE